MSETPRSSAGKRDDAAPVRSIAVVDYDPAWPARFAAIRDGVWPVVADIVVAIEHVGSTSVPGLAAKPVIDLDVVVRSSADVPTAIERLATLGYVHLGDLGVAGREAFRPPAGSSAHNLYVCPPDSTGLANHLTLRDHLRNHPELASAYGALKKRLSKAFTHDIDAYVDAKTDFIIAALREAGLSEEHLESIERANRL